MCFTSFPGFVALMDDDLVGTITTTSYGTELAWIGMMLVHPDFRRRGIATALMKAGLDYLRGGGVRCMKLDATPAGQPVYEKLGFQPEWSIERGIEQVLHSIANGTVQDYRDPKHSNYALLNLQGTTELARDHWALEMIRSLEEGV